LDSSDTQVIQEANTWLREGRQVQLVTVVRTWGSSPRPPGSLLAASDHGRVSGSISGGCVEDDLLLQLSRYSGAATPRLLCYGTTREEANRFGLPCGGRLELVVETLRSPKALQELAGHISSGRIAQRHVNLTDGTASITPAHSAVDHFRFDGQKLVRTFGPRWHLLLIGAGHLSQYVARFARALDFRVTLCDPRVKHATRWSSPDATLIHTMPDEAVSEYTDRRTAVVTLAHDPKIDDLALVEALFSEAFYIGALGSEQTSRKRRERLALLDIPRPALKRLHAPVGLPIGSHTPAEIALSIMAEITAVRNRREPLAQNQPQLHHAPTQSRAG
jgi:xanthine dehydrogenase accessory factor